MFWTWVAGGAIIVLFTYSRSSFSSIIPIESVSVHLDGRWIVSSIQLKSVSRQTVYRDGFFFRV